MYKFLLSVHLEGSFFSFQDLSLSRHDMIGHTWSRALPRYLRRHIMTPHPDTDSSHGRCLDVLGCSPDMVGMHAWNPETVQAYTPRKRPPFLSQFVLSSSSVWEESTTVGTTSHPHALLGIISRPCTCLELHLVGLLAGSEAEAGFEVAGKEFFVLDCRE